MKLEEIDAILGAEAERLNDQFITVPLEFYDGYAWTIHQMCKMDIQLVKHGKWLQMPHQDTQFYVYQCSECGEDTLGRQKYCPNCGAKMND